MVRGARIAAALSPFRETEFQQRKVEYGPAGIPFRRCLKWGSNRNNIAIAYGDDLEATTLPDGGGITVIVTSLLAGAAIPMRRRLFPPPNTTPFLSA